ncbi:hypothetical protein B0H19DRAFT_120153 [Mycena capillaripes]|nr:hypothetical protein B0H19DRAFT_120153 [Mycena capillaripes]
MGRAHKLHPRAAHERAVPPPLHTRSLAPTRHASPHRNSAIIGDLIACGRPTAWSMSPPSQECVMPSPPPKSFKTNLVTGLRRFSLVPRTPSPSNRSLGWSSRASTRSLGHVGIHRDVVRMRSASFAPTFGTSTRSNNIKSSIALYRCRRGDFPIPSAKHPPRRCTCTHTGGRRG